MIHATSYNSIYRDAIITCIVNTMTCLLAGVLVFSILGYMAHIQETTIDDVVNSGPGLVFLTYPDLVLKLPWSVMWAFIFFCMLLVSSYIRLQNTISVSEHLYQYPILPILHRTIPILFCESIYRYPDTFFAMYRLSVSDTF